MACCAATILPFAGVPNMTIAYDASLVAKYGPQPRVEVYYFDPDTNTYVVDNGIPIGTNTFDGANVFCDFGGVATGVVKLS